MRALVKALLFLLVAAVPEANAQDGGLKPGPAATVGLGSAGFHAVRRR